jgi:hypothetical protein
MTITANILEMSEKRLTISYADAIITGMSREDVFASLDVPG